MSKSDIHPWINEDGKTILTQPFFELVDLSNWSKGLTEYYQKINETDDERSFVILLALLMEVQIDSVIMAFFPGYKTLLDRSEITLSIKIELIRSLKIIPTSVLKLADCVRKIRNEFAHHLEFSKIVDLGNNKNKLLVELNRLCKKHNQYLRYSMYSDNYRDKYQDIAVFVIEALKEYEPTIKVIRKEIESFEFKKHLISKYKIQQIK